MQPEIFGVNFPDQKMPECWNLSLSFFVELQIQSRLQPGLKAALQMPFSSSSVFYSVLKMPLRWEFLP